MSGMRFGNDEREALLNSKSCGLIVLNLVVYHITCVAQNQSRVSGVREPR